MIKYIWQVHKPLIIAILVDLIILLLVYLIMLTTGLESQFTYYRSFQDAVNANLPHLGFYLFYQFMIVIQFPLALIATGYLFTASRYQSMLVILGKNTTIALQAITLFLTFLWSIFTIVLGWNLISPNISWYMRGNNITYWLIFVICLVSYHIAFYSTLKYSGISKKIIVLVVTAASVFSVESLHSSASSVTTGLSNYTLNYLASDLNAVGQVSLPAVSNNTTLVFFILVNMLIIVFVSLVELKKVGR